MQPAAARVGPSYELRVRRIAVRSSSGATIWIEKTIKVQFFQAAWKKLFAFLRRKKRATSRGERHSRRKIRQYSGIRSSISRGPRRSALIALRDFGVDSEISEALEQHRVPRCCPDMFYRTDVSGISL